MPRMLRPSNRAAAATLQSHRRRQAMPVENPTPHFDERAIEQIRASLPKGIDQRRLDLLPQVLNEWSRTDLREHLSREARAQSKALRPANEGRKVRNSATAGA